jgi:hypothetical protein
MVIKLMKIFVDVDNTITVTNGNDFISFSQLNKDGSLRLKGDNISVNNIDSHNFIIDYSIIGDTRFIITKYDTDGYFAHECYNKSKNNIWVNKPLSIYNLLR